MPHLLSAAVCLSLFAAQAVCADEPVKEQSKAPPKAVAPKAPPAEVDEDFLEFLANWDSEDETWNDYLATLGKDRKTKDAGKAAPVKPAEAGLVSGPAKEGK